MLPNIATINTYGGPKTNYSPIEDATTDESADDRNEYVADVAGMTQTAMRAMCRFVGHGTTPTDPASNVHFAVWGNDVSVKPTVANAGTGVYTITWPTTINDELDEEYSINLGAAWANVEGSTLYFVQATVTAPNVVTVYVFNSSGAANNAVGVTIGVFAR